MKLLAFYNICRAVKICSTYGGEERFIQSFGGETWGKRPFGTPRRRLDLQEVGCIDMDWIELELDRDRWRALVHEIMNLRVP